MTDTPSTSAATERCRLVCSLGSFAWHPTFRHPFRQVWRYSQAPCPCGARTWRYREANDD